MKRSAVRILPALLLLAATDASAAAPRFLNDETVAADAGYVQLRWERDDASAVVVQQAQDAAFADARVIYRGANESLFLSGLDDGDYYFRIRADDDDTWMGSIEVAVRHQSLTRALFLFGVGAVVFICTLAVILRGARDA